MVVACGILFSLTERSLSHPFIFGTQKGSLIPAFHHWTSLKYYLTMSSVVFLIPLINRESNYFCSFYLCLSVSLFYRLRDIDGLCCAPNPFVVLLPLLFLAPLLLAGGFIEKTGADVCTLFNGKSSVMITSISSAK